MKAKKIATSLFMAAVVAVGLSSCATVSTGAGSGSLYTGAKEGQHVTSNPRGSKVGTAKMNNILGWVVSGDASIDKAAKSAGIKKISHVDCQKKSILGLFGSYTVYVYGE